MATAPKIVDTDDTSRYVAASYCDGNRLYVQFTIDIDADMPPLKEDFTVLRNPHISVQEIDVQISDKQSMIVLVMSDVVEQGKELYLCYTPTQWLMCDMASGDTVSVFDELIIPKPLEALEPSLRLLTKTAQTSTPESATALSQDSVNVRFASEYRLQLYFQVELDTAVSLDPDDFRAETENRWIRVAAVRHVAVRAHSKAEILLELSEPLVPDTHLSVSYRSTHSRLRKADGTAVSPFKINCIFAETEVEALQKSAAEVSGELPGFLDIVDHPGSELSGHSGAELLGGAAVDEDEDDKASLIEYNRDISRDDESDAQELDEEERVPEPEVKKEVVVRAKTFTEKSAPATVISSVKDPAIAAAIAKKAAYLRSSLDGTDNALAERSELSLMAKILYFVPIVVVGWLIFVVCIYLASIAFDISVPSFGSSDSTSGHVPNLAREKCSLTSADGNKYDGECINGERDGFGSYVWGSGNRYEGGWRNGKRHGEGVLVYASGAVYKGEYRNGKEHGAGTMTWSNGAKYKGQYKGGSFHGKGTYTTSSGNRFEGIFKSGSMTQDGTCTLTSGETYPGPCQG